MIKKEWGYYTKANDANIVVKNITVLPRKTLKLKKNSNYSRYVYVISGQASLYYLDSSSDIDLIDTYGEKRFFWIHKNNWYQIVNDTDENLVLLEVKYQ